MHLTLREPVYFFIIHFCFIPLYSVFLIPGVFDGKYLNCGVLHILWPLVFGFDVDFLFHTRVWTHTHTHTHTHLWNRTFCCKRKKLFGFCSVPVMAFFLSFLMKENRLMRSLCCLCVCVVRVSLFHFTTKDWFPRNAMLLKAISRLNFLNFYNRK